ncbi:MAG: sulfatase-like hydrolase/transferase [Opitutae bacterium]|nr:sulfatase-like hydrolase/transferase [Opitutae bacterium]
MRPKSALRPTRLPFPWFSPLAAAAIVVVTSACAGESKPNIVLIVSDDQGYADYSSRGTGQVDTPHLDRLETQSRVFNSFYVEPACAPTRASLLTGRSFIRTGVWSVHFGGDYIGLGETLLPQVLASAGYVTGHIGKWHSGKTPGYLPHERGFGSAVITTMHDHWQNAMAVNEAPRRLADAEYYGPRPDAGWNVDRVNTEAARFLAEHRDRPFFLQVAYVEPHAPWEASEELRAKYKARGQSDRFASLNALIEQMDRSIGRLLADLDRLGLAENTVVLFLSDNGYVHHNVGRFAGELDEHEIAQRNPRHLRGQKGTIYEGGILSPLYVRWPSHIKPGATGFLSHVTDLLPTLADLGRVPAANLPGRLDGRSLVPALLDPAATQPDRIVFGSAMRVPARGRKQSPPLAAGRDLDAERTRLDYQEAHLYARDPRFKLVKGARNQLELFDLRDDPSESHDVSARFPADKQRLEVALRSWFASVLEEPLPFASPTYLIGRSPAGVLLFNGAWKLTGDFRGNELWALSSSATQAGSSVEWHVRVERPGAYTVWLQADIAGADRRVALQAGTQRIDAALSPGSLHQLGRIEIGADVQRVTFTLVNPGSDSKPGIADLWNVVLEPVMDSH